MGWVGFVLLLSSLSQETAKTTPALDGMDVYGVAPSSLEELERCFGQAAREVIASPSPRSRELEVELEREVRKVGRFEAVDVSIVYYLDRDVRIFLTFNIISAGQTPSPRYSPAPTKETLDPAGLLASWREYEDAGKRIGFEIESSKEPPCPAHHCIYGFADPRLAPYAELFKREVPRRQRELVRVLRQDRDAEARLAAAYLLAHLDSAKQVVASLSPQVRDPSPIVRNGILRIFAFMAEHGESRAIPLKSIVPFLHSHVLTDRNKAVAIVAAIAGEKKHRGLLIRQAGCDLVRLLEMKQPNQRDFALQALVKLRGSDLGGNRIEAWKEWLKAQGSLCSKELELQPGTLCALPATTATHLN